MIRVSEAVLPGHPDKLCDFVAESIVQAALAVDPEAYAQIEAGIWCDRLWLSGGYAARGTTLDVEPIAIEALESVARAVNPDAKVGPWQVTNAVCRYDVEPTRWSRHVNDQAIVIGWAGYDAKVRWLPPEHFLVLEFRDALWEACCGGELARCGPDGKLIVRLREDDDGFALEHVLVTLEHPEAMSVFELAQRVSAVLGRVKCRLSVSSQELERDDNTVAVLCHGFLHAVTLAGRGREPLVEYLFGEVEVPSLDDDPGPVPPFDNTRSLALNPHNPRVQVLEAWLGECIDEVLAKLEEREKRRKADRERRLLKRVAGRIKSLLDEDFQAIQAELPWANLPSSRGVDDPSRDSSVPRSADASLSSPPRPSLVKRSLRWLKRLFKGKNSRAETVSRPPHGSPAEFTRL